MMLNPLRLNLQAARDVGQEPVGAADMSAPRFMDPDAVAGDPFACPTRVGTGPLFQREPPVTVGEATHQAAGLDDAFVSWRRHSGGT